MDDNEGWSGGDVMTLGVSVFGKYPDPDLHFGGRSHLWSSRTLWPEAVRTRGTREPVEWFWVLHSGLQTTQTQRSQNPAGPFASLSVWPTCSDAQLCEAVEAGQGSSLPG